MGFVFWMVDFFGKHFFPAHHFRRAKIYFAQPQSRGKYAPRLAWSISAYFPVACGPQPIHQRLPLSRPRRPKQRSLCRNGRPPHAYKLWGGVRGATFRGVIGRGALASHNTCRSDNRESQDVIGSSFRSKLDYQSLLVRRDEVSSVSTRSVLGRSGVAVVVEMLPE